MTVRKPVVILTVLALAMASLMGPAAAAKKKSGSFAAEALPFPHPDGCNAGVDGVHLVNEPFKAPFNGLLTVTMSGFDGDWDLFLNDADGNMIMGATESQLQGAAPTEEVVYPLKKGTEVVMMPCNWVGGPGATVDWEIVALK
jgi:hypothetical protein